MSSQTRNALAVVVVSLLLLFPAYEAISSGSFVMITPILAVLAMIANNQSTTHS